MFAQKTLERLDGMAVYHFSVFIENKVGALLEVVKLINEHSVAVLAVSMVDSSESAIARLIVSDPDRVKQLFNERDIPHSISTVLLVELPQSSSDFAQVLTSLLMAEVNVSFAYSLLIRPRGKAVLVLHPDDRECASSVLISQGFQLLNQSDLSR